MGIVTLIGMMNAAIVMRNAETVYANAHMDIMQNMESAVSITISFYHECTICCPAFITSYTEALINVRVNLNIPAQGLAQHGLVLKRD